MDSNPQVNSEWLEGLSRGESAAWSRFNRAYDSVIDAIIRWPSWGFSATQMTEVGQQIRGRMMRTLHQRQANESMTWFVRRTATAECLSYCHERHIGAVSDFCLSNNEADRVSRLLAQMRDDGVHAEQDPFAILAPPDGAEEADGGMGMVFKVSGGMRQLVIAGLIFVLVLIAVVVGLQQFEVASGRRKAEALKPKLVEGTYLTWPSVAQLPDEFQPYLILLRQSVAAQIEERLEVKDEEPSTGWLVHAEFFNTDSNELQMDLNMRQRGAPHPAMDVSVYFENDAEFQERAEHYAAQVTRTIFRNQAKPSAP